MGPSKARGDLGTLSIEAVLFEATRRTLRRGSRRHAAASFGVEAEELCANPVVVEASVGAPVRLALPVQRDVGSGKAAWAGEGVVRVVGSVVEAGGGRRPQEVFHLFDGAI